MAAQRGVTLPEQHVRASFVERLPLFADAPAIAAAITLGFVALSTIVRFVLDPVLPPGFPFITFFPSIFIVGSLLGPRWGMVSAVLCGLIAAYYFIPPAHSFVLKEGGMVAMTFYVFVAGVHMALVYWMIRANRRLVGERARSEQLARTRALLFDELQHRVSNNIQVAASLLALQRRGITDPTARTALDESARRLAIIGQISRSIYSIDGTSRPIRGFLTDLGKDVLETFGRDDIALRVTGDEDATLPPAAAIPTALIVAEGIANAVEHGYADRGGTIDVTVDAGPGGIDITVSDHGRGLPDGFDLAKTDSLGLRIARTLAQTLKGEFTLSRESDVTRSRLVLPV